VLASKGRPSSRLAPVTLSLSRGTTAIVREFETDESALVQAARDGDHDAFRALIEPLGRELHVLCYRMTGSFHDAEDVLQEAMLNAWRRLETYDGRASFRAWLYGIATNASLDAVRRRRRRLLPQHRGAPTEVLAGEATIRDDLPWLEPYPDSHLSQTDPQAALELRESVRLALLRALQTLSPRQRAVLVLRDVLDWPAADVASMLETTVPAVNSALQRARATIGRAGPGQIDHQQATARDAQEAEMAAKYISAWEAGDIDGFVAMLAEDAIQSMPPWEEWFFGRDALRKIYLQESQWGGPPASGRFRVLRTHLNGQLAFAEYTRQEPVGPYKPFCLSVVTLTPDGTLISEVTSFLRPELFAEWGYPLTLPG
jgi:RNA polymerase sigma-70 factor (ECF subfamily)